MTKFFERYRASLVAILLLLMLALGLASMAQDSGIVDEVAHIPAGWKLI